MQRSTESSELPRPIDLAPTAGETTESVLARRQPAYRASFQGSALLFYPARSQKPNWSSATNSRARSHFADFQKYVRTRYRRAVHAGGPSTLQVAGSQIGVTIRLLVDSLAGVALLFPRISAVVVSRPFPEAQLVFGHELQGANPFRALPQVPGRNQCTKVGNAIGGLD